MLDYYQIWLRIKMFSQFAQSRRTSSGEMKLMMKFCLCFHKITELWSLFSLVPMGNYFSVLKCKNDCKIFKIALVQIFVHQNLKLLHLLPDIVLKWQQPFHFPRVFPLISDRSVWHNAPWKAPLMYLARSAGKRVRKRVFWLDNKKGRELFKPIVWRSKCKNSHK